MEALAIDPGSVARGHLTFWIALATVMLVTGPVVAALGRRAWWLVILAVLLIPTLATLALSGRLEWSETYLPDVVLPLALGIGLPGGLFGSGLGALARRWWLRARPVRLRV